MDELEKKELKQETVSETIEPAEETVETTETSEEPEEMTAEEAAEVAEETVETTEEAPKKKSKAPIFLLILILVVAAAAYGMMSGGGKAAKKDAGVFYAKENDLYYYDMKNEPYLVQEDISAGGAYNYFYTAWGAGTAEESDIAYYMANVDAAGAADLYRRDMKDPSAEAVLVDSDVYDYQVSKDGETVAYVVMQDDVLELRMDCGSGNEKIAENFTLEEEAYQLRADGKWLVFKDAYDMLCAAEVQEDGDVNVWKLTDVCPLYALSEDVLYFVSKADANYNIYSFDFENEPELVAENAQYMSLMPNGTDLLYGVKPTDVIPYSELLEDDMAEIDAKMTADDPNYDQKLMRDDLRAAMASGEGLEPLMMEYYLISGGKTTLVAENVVSAVAVAGSEKSFVAGYQAKPFQPLYLSVIGGGLEMVDMIYYMSINYGGMQPFLADANGNTEVLTGSAVHMDSIRVSSDGRRAAYLVDDAETGGNALMQMEFGSSVEATVVQNDVEDFAFLGGDGPLVYYYEYAKNAGTLASVDSDRTIRGVTGVTFAEDAQEVYYIKDINGSTGVGQMQHWNGKDEATIVDGGVFAFQYKGNGKAAVLFDYDVMKLTGILGYYDGNGVTILDENVTALYIN